MGAVEVLVDHLDGRIRELALQLADERRLRERDRDEADLRIGGLEQAADALGPLTGVPATVSALEQELISLGERLDIAAREAGTRHELISREIDARISVSESRLALRQSEEWESAQDALAEAEARARRSEGKLEERLAEQAEAASSALADLESRITASLESLAGRMGATAGASGALAETTVSRLEMLEADITEIESRFAAISDKLAARRAGRDPERPSNPIEAAEWVPETPTETVQENPGAEVRFEAEQPPRGIVGPPAGMIDLNEATFEVLRSLGCSVTQTARILSARKLRGGFDSPDELSDVPGLPDHLREQLIGRLTT
jgi:hypothetical protein